jgi:hypothetical protein
MCNPQTKFRISRGYPPNDDTTCGQSWKPARWGRLRGDGSEWYLPEWPLLRDLSRNVSFGLIPPSKFSEFKRPAMPCYSHLRKGVPTVPPLAWPSGLRRVQSRTPLGRDQVNVLLLVPDTENVGIHARGASDGGTEQRENQTLVPTGAKPSPREGHD